MSTHWPNQALQPTAPGVVRAGQKFTLRRPVRWLTLGRYSCIEKSFKPSRRTKLVVVFGFFTVGIA